MFRRFIEQVVNGRIAQQLLVARSSDRLCGRGEIRTLLIRSMLVVAAACYNLSLVSEPIQDLAYRDELDAGGVGRDIERETRNLALI